jgi:hypothetical protein
MIRFFLLSLLIVVSSVGKAQIKISAQKNIDFTKYKTFAVEKGQVISLLKDTKVNEKKLYDVMNKTISTEMVNRGYAVTSDSLAHLSISYFLKESLQSNYQKAGPLGQTPTQDPTVVDEANRAIVERTLIIEIEDNRDESSLWTATCTLEHSQKDVYNLLIETVEAAFQKLKSKKK